MTYADLALAFVSGALVLAVVVGRAARLPRQWWWSTFGVGAVLVLLTVVFDTLMIASDLFTYDTAALLGWRVALVPVEDLAWPLVAVLALPALWELSSLLTGRRDPRGDRH